MSDNNPLFVHGIVGETPVSIPLDRIDRIELMENGKAAVMVGDSRILTELTIDEIERMIVSVRLENLVTQRP